MEQNDSQFVIETHVTQNDVRVIVNRKNQRFGTVVLDGSTICWVPDEQGADTNQQKTWVMAWEDFARTMQSYEAGEVAGLTQSAWTMLSRAGAGTIRKGQEKEYDEPEEFWSDQYIYRHFNIAEFALIRKGIEIDLFEREPEAAPITKDVGQALNLDGLPWRLRGQCHVYYDSEDCALWMNRVDTGEIFACLIFNQHAKGAEISIKSRFRNDRYAPYGSQGREELLSWLVDYLLLGRPKPTPPS
jgi:hypothetical protein